MLVGSQAVFGMVDDNDASINSAAGIASNQSFGSQLSMASAECSNVAEVNSDWQHDDQARNGLNTNDLCARIETGISNGSYDFDSHLQSAP